MASEQTIPVIDLFAGPGGLGEGFSALEVSNQRVFHSTLSIEKEASAHQTLRLRSFFRRFARQEVPDEYYRLLRGEISLDELYDAHPDQALYADKEAWHAELGEPAVQEIRSRISDALDGADPWVLLGGPPCQPFSLAGRSRNSKGTRYSGAGETRHQLYVEYLQIIADFWPAVFVMENVHGLLSAEFNGEGMFRRIAEDLHEPASAIFRTPGRGRLKRKEKHTYRLYPIAPRSGNGGNGSFGDLENLRDYIVRCEQHGVPQSRHRVILIGVRDDIEHRPELLPPRDPIPAERVLTGLPPLRSGLSRDDDVSVWRQWIADAMRQRWFKALEKDDPETCRFIRSAVRERVHPEHDRGADFVRASIGIDYAPEWFLADRRLGGVCNHHTRGHMPSDLHRYLFAACYAQAHGRSPGLSEFPRDLLPDHVSAERAMAGGYFADRFRVQIADKPATTIVSHIAKDGHYYIHPDPAQCRSLTVREAARLQTFPDDYYFVGNRTQQYVQVGNAVPPLLARRVAGVVHCLLRRSGLA